MRALRCFSILTALATLVGGCSLGTTGSSPSGSAAAGSSISEPSPGRPTLILVGLDGFRWDFIARGATPTLTRLAESGVHAERLIPSFPTKTFPNHYTIVTGLRPSEHGLVANNVLDPQTGDRFGLGDREAVRDGKWYGGEPIWVTAERQGTTTAPLFWPGSEAEIGGVRPTHRRTYDHDMSPEDRVDLLLEWLDLPPPERPGFLTLYLSNVDSAAHEHGPEPSVELESALRIVDRTVERLLDGLEQRGLAWQTDLMIVSDHGMAATSRERVIQLDRYIDPELANVVDWDPVLALWPPPEQIDGMYNALVGAHPKLAVFRRGELPAHLEFDDHERIAPIIGLAAEGWSITSSDRFERCPQCFDGGSHGFDSSLVSMGALFIAHGPSFRRGKAIPPIENVDLYNLMCAVLGLEAAENGGDRTRLLEILAPEVASASPPGPRPPRPALLGTPRP